MASTPRSRGNSLFKASDFVAAAAAYTEGISSQLSEQVSRLQRSFASLGLPCGPARNESTEGVDRRRVASGSSCDSSCTTIIHSAGDNAVFIQAAKASDAEEQMLLLSNRAACHLETGNLAAAAADALVALTLEPCNPKAYFRLARALPRDDPAAAPIVAAAVALHRPGQHSEALGSLYAEVRAAWHAEHAAVQAAVGASATSQAAVDDETDTSTGAVVWLQLPGDLALITCVGSAMELDMAMRRKAEVVVLRPGPAYYSPCAFTDCRHSFSLVGLGPGGVELRAQAPSHALWLMQPAQATLVNLKLRGGGHGAAAALSDPGAVLQLSRCRVEDYPEVAVLVVGGRAKMDCCTFTRTAKQAVEVREGGKLLARQLTITDCHQGVSAYGGARLLLLQDCTIERCRNEGVLIAGSFTNAATEMQALLPQFLNPEAESRVGRDVSAAAAAWGKQMGTALTAVLLGCTVRGCGRFGVSADSGARVIIQGCLLEANDPFSAIVKGGTDALIAACQLHYSGAKSKSSWQGSGPKVHQSGIEVAINYHGCVEVVGNAFVGPQELAILDWGTADNGVKSKAGSKATLAKVGMWSRPVTAQRNSHHDPSNCAYLPSLESLIDALPTRFRIREGAASGSNAPDGGTNAGGQALPNMLRPSLGAGARIAAAAPAVSAMQRPCSVFAQAAWSPTGHEFYAIGNTLGYDVTAGQGHVAAALSPGGEVRVLLGACGDVRNLLATVHAVMTSMDAPGGRRPRITCVLNDGNISMLARNAALLHMAAVCGAPAEAVLAVWACHGLSLAHRQLLDASLTQLAEEPWPEWLSASASLASSSRHPVEATACGGTCAGKDRGDAEHALRTVFGAWAGCTMPLKQVLALRGDMLGAAEDSDMSLVMSLRAARASLGPAASTVAAGKLQREVAAYVRTGSLEAEEGQPLKAANPTFLLAPELQYTVYFSSSIFRALPLTSDKGAPSAKAMLLATLGPQLQSVVEALKDGRLQVTLVCGDILAALLAPPLSPEPLADGLVGPESFVFTTNSSDGEAGGDAPPPQEADDRHDDQQGSRSHGPWLFDFIDASNVADYVSLPSLVQGALPLLRPAPHARLHAESIVLYGMDAMQGVGMDHRGFVTKRLGMPLQDFELLLGASMRVCEPIAGQEGVRMQWQRWPVSGKEECVEPGTQQQEGMEELRGRLSRLRLSEEHLLEKLRPAFHRFVSSFVSSPAAARGGEGTPLTLVHLLSLVAPQEAEGLLRQLLAGDSASSSSGSGSNSSGGGLFKWELIMHAQVQAGKKPILRRVKYAAQPGFSMVMHSERPLLLAVSKEELKRNGVTAPPAVKQLLSAFAWDEAMAVAHVLLPESILEQCGAWRLTLCALSKHVGLVVVGASSRLDTLPSEVVAAGPWRRMPPE